MPVEKRNEKWYYNFSIRKHRYRRVIPTARIKKEAIDAESEARLKVLNGTYEEVEAEPEVTLAGYAENQFLPWSKEHKRSTNDKYHVATIKAWFGDRRFDEVSPMLIEKFKRERRSGLTRYKRQRCPASVNRELACLSRIFTLAVRDGLTSSNPCAQVQKLTEDNKRFRYLSVEEEEALLEQFIGRRAHIRAVVILALHCGLRRGEILSLQKSSVDFMRNLIHVRQTKNGKDRYVPMNPVSRTELLTLYERASTEFLFLSPKKTGTFQKDLKTAFAAARKSADLDDFRFHDLRHTFGTRLADSGADPFTIMELMGHSDLRMTARYTHATDHNKRSAVERLADYGASEKARRKNVATLGRKIG